MLIEHIGQMIVENQRLKKALQDSILEMQKKGMTSQEIATKLGLTVEYLESNELIQEDYVIQEYQEKEHEEEYDESYEESYEEEDEYALC